MPPSLRRRGQNQAQPPPHEILSESDDEFADIGVEEEQDDTMSEEEAAHISPEEEEEEPIASPSPSHLAAHQQIPPGLREISTLASWTVSSSKPGNSIPQLRHPSPSLFWQSDGPQPHYLNIHFFKLVRIVGLRLYLDFEQDESYTPTRIALLAGSGMNDLVEWGEMKLESPRGWVWANFDGVGEPEGSDDDEDDGEEEKNNEAGPHAEPPAEAVPDVNVQHEAPRDDGSEAENTAPQAHMPAPVPADPMLLDPQQQQQRQQQQQQNPPNTNSANYTSRKPAKMPVLRCHLVQIKIMENHQNGKDTHLRGLQIFARDNDKDARPKKVQRRGEKGGGVGGAGGDAKKGVRGFATSAWMEEPVLR